MSATFSGMPGGQPSTTQPSATPWLSPNVVTRNRWPKVLWDIAFRPCGVVVARVILGVKRRCAKSGFADECLLFNHPFDGAWPLAHPASYGGRPAPPERPF